MKIDKLIESYSITLAFGILLAENPEITESSFIDITDIIGTRSIEQYKGLGLLFCIRTCNLGTNENKVQFKIDENIQPGTKEWSTEYVLVTDHKKSGKIIVIGDKVSYKIKGEAETAAKLWVAENKRDLHIKMVKIMQNADPVSTSILYKPSLKQSMAVYHFFN